MILAATGPLPFEDYQAIAMGLHKITGCHVPLAMPQDNWCWHLPDENAHAIFAALKLRGLSIELELRDD